MNVDRSGETLLQAARVLTVAGIALIATTMINLVLLLVPGQGGIEAKLSFSTQFVEWGVIPLLGIGLIFGGFSFQQLSGVPPRESRTWTPNLRVLSCWLSLGLAIAFLWLVPTHISNVLQARSQTLEKVQTEAKESLEQLDGRLAQERSEFEALLADEQRLKEYLNSGTVSEDKLNRLKEIQTDPAALDRQMTQVRYSLEQQINQRQRDAQYQSKIGAIRSSVRICLSSLVLAGCYGIVGWKGLAKPRSAKPPVPKPKQR